MEWAQLVEGDKTQMFSQLVQIRENRELLTLGGRCLGSTVPLLGTRSSIL